MSLYSEKLKNPKWQKRRLEIFNRDNWKCQKCSDNETELVVHHKFYDKNTDPWQYGDDDLSTLCVNCHENEHKIIDTFHIKNLMSDTIDKIEENYRKENPISGVRSGFNFLDYMIGGFQKSELIIIASRPSVGKTAFALNIARNIAVESKTPIMMFSLEMDNSQISLRMSCSEAKVDSSRIKSGYISQEDWQNITDATRVLSEAPLFIDTSMELSLNTIERRIKATKIDKNIKIAIIDNIQLISKNKFESSEIVRRLKRLAKEINIPIIALSQLDSKLEDRADKRPMLSDMNGKGIVSKSDVIVFIYRDEIYNKEPDNPRRGTAEIYIAKNRNGPTGISSLLFTPKYARFDNAQKEALLEQEFE